MFSIQKSPIPVDTFLASYLIEGAYTDAYSTEVPGQVSLSEFIFAFYTTRLFNVERWILARTVSKPSTDLQARQIADGSSEAFAAWRMEARNENELLMCDFSGRTRSWFMVVPANTHGEARTRLYFGSAVVPVQSLKTRKASLGLRFQALLGFHKIYSILLLYFAKSRMQSQPSKSGQ